MEYEIFCGGEVQRYENLKGKKAILGEFYFVRETGRAYMYDKEEDEWFVYGG